MRAIAFVAAAAILSGCGATSSLKGRQETDFAIVSKGQAGGVYRMIRGELVFCKISIHGSEKHTYTVTLDDDECLVEITGHAK